MSVSILGVEQPPNNSQQLGEDLREWTSSEFQKFLEEFREGKSRDGELEPQDSQTVGRAEAENGPKYLAILGQMASEERETLDIDYEDIDQWYQDLALNIQENFYRFEVILRKALQRVVRKHHPAYAENFEGTEREFWISIYNCGRTEKLRSMTANDLGKFLSFSGTVTRTSEVRPELYLATFRCQECNTIVRDVAQQFRFTVPCICANEVCQNRNHWTLLREDSKFIDWQRLRVQESSDEVPAGCLPRTIDVILRNSAVDKARAGDKVVFNGCIIAVPDVSVISAPGERVTSVARNAGAGGAAQGGGENTIRGLKATGVRELSYKLCFLGSSVQSAEDHSGVVNIRSEGNTDSAEDVLGTMSSEEQRDIALMKKNRNLYRDLVGSIAPGVFGGADVKKAMLLMLMGGVHKSTKEGISLRGDINIIIIGDPSCAKSQLLKYIAKFLPRAVYTSGKASSAAGLTATVVKEPETNDYCIEAGALMLADNGICCIDEFDKMDSKDQVAIHEAMEQQTISIAKAGIQATLNARTSVFAASNPREGRYDRSKPLKYNISLPPAIMSRFDLVHVMIDEPDDVLDRSVAEHIVKIHKDPRNSLVTAAKYKMSEMQRYIKYVRAIKPRLSEPARRLLVESYKQLRSEDAAPGSSTAYRITVRQLEALIRLSEARARVDASEVVTTAHVKEATRLLKASIISVDSPEIEFDDKDCEDGGGDEEWLAREGLRDSEEDPEQEEEAQRGAGGREADGTNSLADMSEPALSSEPSPAVDAGKATEGHQEAAAPTKTKISAEKFGKIRDMLVAHLRQLEENPEDGEELSTKDKELGYRGCLRQNMLVRWYLEMLITRKELRSRAHAQEELQLCRKVIVHLIRREGILVELSKPVDKGDGETDEQFRLRVQENRVLALSPNYDPSN